MTREKFEEIRAEVLGEIKNAAERERIRAVTYAQGMQNQRDGLPLFGWNPKIPAKDRELLAEAARRHGYGAKSIH